MQEIFKTLKLKLQGYDEQLEYASQYITFLPGFGTTKNVNKAEINNIIIHSVPNRWAKKTHIKSFNLE